MAKIEVPQPNPQPAPAETDVNPEQAFKAAWNKDRAIRAVLTIKGKIRGNLKPSQVKEAKAIRDCFGL